MSFLSNLLSSVLSSQIVVFITKGFWKLRRKLKSSRLWIWIELLLNKLKLTIKYWTSYWDKQLNEEHKATHWLKVRWDYDWWWWELQDGYSNKITNAVMPYETPLEATNNAQMVLKWFTVVQEHKYSWWIYMLWIYAPHLLNHKS